MDYIKMKINLKDILVTKYEYEKRSALNLWRTDERLPHMKWFDLRKAKDSPANLTWNLFSGLRIWTYRGQFGAKSFTAQARRMVWWSYKNKQHSDSVMMCKLTLFHFTIYSRLSSGKLVDVFYIYEEKQ